MKAIFCNILSIFFFTSMDSAQLGEEVLTY